MCVAGCFGIINGDGGRMKYRKKPIVIEAMQLNRNFADVVCNWIIENGGRIHDYNYGEFSEDSCLIEIETLEGNIVAREGEYIIKGIKGEFYPCKEDIFEMTYEVVRENE